MDTNSWLEKEGLVGVISCSSQGTTPPPPPQGAAQALQTQAINEFLILIFLARGKRFFSKILQPRVK